MVTNRKKLRNRKQLLIKIFGLLTAFLMVILAAYFTSIKLFAKPIYISPLATLSASDVVNADANNLDLIKKTLVEQKVAVASTNKTGSSYIITLKDNSTIILSSQKDIHSQISSLQFILSRLTMEDKLFTQLDLRFDKPVIKLRN